MLRANRPTRSLPLWLLPLLLIAATAGESIGFPHMVSNLPKRSCSAKHSRTLLQLAIHHTAFICDVEDPFTFQLRHNEHHIVFMRRARWLEAYIDPLISDRTQLVAPNMPCPFAKPTPGANENCLWTLRRHNQTCDRNRLRHGLTKKSKPQSLTARVEPIHTAALMLLKLTHFVTIFPTTYLHTPSHLFTVETQPLPHAHSKAPEHDLFHCHATKVPGKATDQIICEHPANQSVFSRPISCEIESTKNFLSVHSSKHIRFT